MKVSEVKLIKFIKQYPRVSFLFFIIIFLIVCFQPMSLEQKIMVPIKGVVIGFIIAAIFWYLKYKYLNQHR